MSKLGNLATKTGWSVSELFQWFRDETLEQLIEFQRACDQIEHEERKRQIAQIQRG